MTIDSEKNIVTGKDIYIEDAKKDFLSNVNFIGDTTQETEDPIQWKEAQGNDLHLTDISLTEVKDFNVLGDSKQEEIEAVEGKSIEGEYITVTDADLSKEFSLEYLGNSKQEQREGYNLFDAINSYPETHTKTGITFTKNSDGTFNAHGTATSDTSIGLATGIMGYLVAGEEYSLYSNIPYNNNTFNLSLTYGGEGMTNKYILANSSKILDDITQWATLNLYIPNGQTINVDNVKVMICKGAYDSSKPFEQYGATPSIEIPSEIENVKAYNLFDKDNVINDKFVSNDIVSNTSWCYYETSNLSINKKYIVNARTILSFYNEDTNISYLDTQINFDTPISIPENTTKVYISIQKTNLETYMFVEEKNKDKPYAPYGAISIGLGNKNILPITYTKGQHIDSVTGITIDFIEKNRIKLNGTATSSLSLNTITGTTFTWKKGKTYSLQLKIIEGSYSTQSLVLHTGFKNEFKNIYNNLQADSSNNFKKAITINEDGYSDKCIIYANSGVVFNNLIVEIQLEENTTTTEIVVPQEQNYNLHISDLELNGIGDLRDSFVVELDNSYSNKKIKNLYLNKKLNKHIFTGKEACGFFNAPNEEKAISSDTAYFTITPNLKVNMATDKKDNILCNIFVNKFTTNQLWGSYNDDYSVENVESISLQGEIRLRIFKNRFPSWDNNLTATKKQNLFKNYITDLYNQGNPMYAIYELNEPQLIELTEDYPELVQDIENIMNNMELYEETTHLYTSGNLVIKLDYNYITPLPSINRPSEIENLTGDVDVEIVNGNINDEVYELGGFTNDTGENVNQSDRFRIKNYIDIEKFQSVIIKSNVQSFINAVGRYGLFDKNKVQIENAQITSTNYTINTKNAKYLRFWFLNNPSENFDMNTAKILVSNNSDISYISHQSQTYPLHLGDLELNGIEDIRDSFVVELDNSYSYKKVKKLYLKNYYEKINDFSGASKQNTSDGTTSRLYKRLGTSYLKCDTGTSAKAMSNILKLVGNGQTYSKIEGFTVGPISGNENMFLWIYINGYDNLSAEEYIAKLNENGAYFILPLETPELIDLTEDYPQLVEDIENILNNIELYEDVTNIYIDGLGEIYIKYDGYDGTPALENPSEVFNITGEQTVTITNTNKFNLLNYQLPGTTYEKNGITFIMNNDGTIDLYGYADEDAEWYLVGGVDKNYDTIMSFDSEYTLQLYENKDSNVFIYLMNDSKVIAMTNLKDNFSYNGDIDTIMIRVNKGTTVDTTIYPILTEETEQEAEEREEDYTKANQQLYKIRLKDLELNGDNNVRDTFEIEFTQDDTGFKNITKLYHNKNFNKYIFTGEENITLNRIQNGIARFDIANIFNNKVNSMFGIYCNYLKNDVTEVENTIRSGENNFISICVIYIDQNIANTAESLKAYLKRLYDEGNPMYVIYQLANTEKVLIQDEDLIQDLENLLNAITYEGVNKIKSTATVVIEYTVKYKDNYDFYIDENDKFFCVPQYGIKFLFSPMESNIPEIAEATESTVKIANKDGDLVLSTTYEPISLDIVCYTDENLDAKQKIAEISKVTRFLDSIKYKTKKIALLSSERMFPVKYNKNLTPTRYPKSIRFSIPLKSSKSYSNVLYPTKIFGNGEEYSNTIRETGCIITIYGPAQTPIIYLNGYEMKYDNVILDGNKLIIDTGNSTVTHVTSKDVRTNAAIYYNHEYPKIQNGINKIEIKSGIGYDKQVITEWYDLNL